MRVTNAAVAREREWVHERGSVVVPLANAVREDLGRQFDADVAPVRHPDYHAAVDAAFDDPDVAPNVAALVGLLRDLDAAEDYPGFVVDELLGRELAATLAGGQPLRLLAEATFHYADVTVADGESAGADDLDAALAAGFQTRLPGWPWRERPGPFG